MSGSQVLHVHTRLAKLDFEVQLPADWIAQALPSEDPNFDDPSHLMALSVVTAPDATVAWTAGARPAYSVGTLNGWANYLLEQGGLGSRVQGEGRLGSLLAVVGVSVQPSEFGELQVRFAIAENAGQIFNVTLVAYESDAQTTLPVWERALASFAIGSSAGSV
jgi:hypothetical protein